MREVTERASPPESLAMMTVYCFIIMATLPKRLYPFLPTNKN
ncbi:MAG: hypothetical protein QG577_1203 [Thermodesulfobacteriota bacterium]|nr:hypothetical protein [Thermodesulfobacteriota bacterium]